MTSRRQAVTIERYTIQLPSSSPTRRGRIYSWAKLLYHVEPDASGGFGFEGKLLKPGASVPESALWPTPEYPKTPILLEYVGTHGMGTAEPNAYQRKHNLMLYVLWRFDADTREWCEIGRAVEQEWAMILRPLAIHALAVCRRPPVPVFRDLPAITARIEALLDGELQPLQQDEQAQVLDVLHNAFATRRCV